MSSRDQVTVTIPPISCFGNAIYGLNVSDCLLDVTFCVLKDVAFINELWRRLDKEYGFTPGVNMFW